MPTEVPKSNSTEDEISDVLSAITFTKVIYLIFLPLRATKMDDGI